MRMFGKSEVETNCGPAAVESELLQQRYFNCGYEQAERAFRKPARLDPLYEEVKETMKRRKCSEEKAVKLVKVDLFEAAIKLGEFDKNPRGAFLHLLDLIP